jgi:hypothetical protein
MEEDHQHQIHVIALLLLSLFVEMDQLMLRPHAEIPKELIVKRNANHLHLHHHHHQHQHNVIAKDKQEYNVEFHQQLLQPHAETKYLMHVAPNVKDLLHHLHHL